jgi:SIT4-associating protein SAP185/190
MYEIEIHFPIITNIVQWLHSQDLMPILLSFLSSKHSWATQTSAGDFLKAIITISANASQNEQSCIGPNELTRQLVSQQCIERLISDMLKGGNPLTVGVGIVIEVIRKNNSDYDPEVGAEANSVPSSRDPIYLGTLLRMFAQRVPDFMELILSPNHTIGGGDGPVTIRRKELNAAFGGKIEPLGFDRFKTCELMAELLHCSNMGLLNEIGSEEFVKARDAERERLKSEGKLGISAHQSALSMEELTMKSSTQTRLGSPGGLRKLEVQNASDDDGFEEVTHAADLGDDAKDDFDEKPEPEEDILTPTNATTPLSFMDKDDEEFVDEPLSSPRLRTAELDLSHQFQDPEMAVAPLSPTKVPIQLEELSQQVEPLATAPLPEESSETLPVTEEKPSEHEIAETSSSLDSLAHPEDKPAPLFAKKAEPTEELTSIHVDRIDQLPEQVDPHSINKEREESQLEDVPSTNSEHPSEVPPVPEGGSGGESLDTTKGEAGDSSIIIETDESHQDSTLEVPTTQVVGDFLKMQFVEHKVVPTILVSLTLPSGSISNLHRISSFDFLGIIFYIMSSMTLYNRSLMVPWTADSIDPWPLISSRLGILRCELSMDRRRVMKHKRRTRCV